MFLRKMFSSNNKVTWVLVDLIVVVMGVYGAFYIEDYANTQKNRQEQVKVLSALKYELEFFRYRMFETSIGMRNKATELQKTLSKKSYSNFSNYRFIEPQYDYQTIDYALKIQNNDIVDFELYNLLQSLFVEIKKVEHAERLLTETSRLYKSLPKNLNKKSNEYQIMWTQNYDNFVRFVTLIRDRAQISKRIAAASATALPLLNERLGTEKTKEIETIIIKKNIGLAKSEEQAIALGKRFFPSFTENELRDIYQQIIKNSKLEAQ